VTRLVLVAAAIFCVLILMALFLSVCPQCLLALPFPQHLAPGATLADDQAWITTEYKYLDYGTNYVGTWTRWRVYASASNNVVTYTGYICKTKDCGLYLGDVIAVYGSAYEVHHAWTICVYSWPDVWATVSSGLKRGRFGCRDLRRAVRSISFR